MLLGWWRGCGLGVIRYGPFAAGAAPTGAVVCVDVGRRGRPIRKLDALLQPVGKVIAFDRA